MNSARQRDGMGFDRRRCCHTLLWPIVKILVLTNLYPPHHAGTYDFRVQALTDALRLRGHTTQVLTSKHGMTNEQRGAEVERRLVLNGVYEHPAVTRQGELRALEIANHAFLRE